MKFEILGPNNDVLNVAQTDAATVRIGKNASCELCLDDASVSRVHAVLERTAQGYKLSDRISVSGTFVNDAKVESTKPVFVESGSILRFGNVSVRVTFEDEAEGEEEGGATLTVDAPLLESMAASGSDEQPKPTIPSAPAASAPAMPATPSMPSISKMPPVAAAAAAPKPSGSFGGGFSSAGNAGNGAVTIIRKKKRNVSFERRFLSNRGKTNDCLLEVALVWQGNVLRLDQFEAKKNASVTVGLKDSDYVIDLPGGIQKCAIAQYDGTRWNLCFNTSFKGFLLMGDDKRPFESCSTSEFKEMPRDSQKTGAVPPGMLVCPVDGSVRAKYEFGDASILVRYTDKTVVAAPILGRFELNKYGNWVASLLIHAALFSVILFATDRVDALMIDRIMTASRFATVIETPTEEEEEDVDKPDEEEPEEEIEDNTEVTEATDTPFAANVATNSASSGAGVGSGSGMSKGEANAAAQATGLLAQSNAMNSMLAAGMDMGSFDNLDWSSFDSSAQAATAGYGLGTTGTGGGGASLGGFAGGGFGPGGGGGGGGAITAAAKSFDGDLGNKREAKPQVKMKNPDVSGSLDKRIIQKVVRQHTGELRACYEREVAKVKGLNGVLTVVWLISPQGAVTKVILKSSTMNNKNVEKCVTDSIKFWRFPQPRGGGAVQVEYPFDFQVN